jgi:hypothetical protein
VDFSERLACQALRHGCGARVLSLCDTVRSGCELAACDLSAVVAGQCVDVGVRGVRGSRHGRRGRGAESFARAGGAFAGCGIAERDSAGVGRGCVRGSFPQQLAFDGAVGAFVAASCGVGRGAAGRLFFAQTRA